jgi:hypothetical protein
MRLIPIDVNTPQEKLAEDIARAIYDAGLVGSLEAMPVAIKVMGMCQRFLDVDHHTSPDAPGSTNTI